MQYVTRTNRNLVTVAKASNKLEIWVALQQALGVQPDLDLLEFRPTTFHLLTERITVSNDGKIKVHWRDNRSTKAN